MNELDAHEVSVALRGRWVVQGVSLRFSPGQLSVIIGPNGAGKTSLLRVLAGLQHLSAGTVTLEGKDLNSIPRRMLAQRLSFVPQGSHFPFAFTVREVVATGRNPYRRRFQREQATDREGINEALALTDLFHLANRWITELSGGERQRVMIARSLATQAPVILLDEPTANLDPAHAIDIFDLCHSLVAAGKLVILTTQDLPMAVRYADRVVIMESGRLVHTVSRDELVADSALASVFGVSATWAYTADGDETLLLRRADAWQAKLNGPELRARQ